MKRILQLLAVLVLASVAGFAQQTVQVTDGSNTIGSAAHPVQVSLANTGTNSNAVTVSFANGQTTAVTQATGTNLHAVIDSGSTTAVTQATGTNLHAVIDSGSTTAVTQATGTNLHTVVDSGTITANLGPATSGGLSMTHFVAAATDNHTNVKSTAGQLYSVHGFNTLATPLYFKLYDSSSTPTGCGATNLKKVIAIQAGTEFLYTQPQGVAFASGIGYCLTSGITDADDTATTLSAATIDLDYK